MPSTVSRKQYFVGATCVVVAAIGLYGILPQIGEFDQSLAILKQANFAYALAAIGATIMSVVFSAFIYQTLALKQLKYRDTLLVQLSGLFINRILPAGVGGLGLNFLYLRARKHTIAQATSVVALNNSIGLIGHVILALLLLLAAPTLFAEVELPMKTLLAIGACLVVVMIIAVIVARHRPNKVKAWRKVLRYYALHPSRLGRAVVISLALTLSNVCALWLCCQALNLPLSFVAVFVVFTFGIVAGTATPTPGGLGGAEAGLVAALISQDVTASLALAAALLFRLSSYWIGLLIGACAFAAVYKRRLLYVAR